MNSAFQAELLRHVAIWVNMMFLLYLLSCVSIRVFVRVFVRLTLGWCHASERMTMQGTFHGRGLSGFTAAVLALSVLLGGCSGLGPATVPLRTIDLQVGSGRPARTLVVLLPGRFDRPESFARFGFAELAARAGAEVDIVAVDAHLAYYRNRSVVDRLREDVIAPVRGRYDRIWLAGISLGGTGALLYTIEHPEDVSGLLLLAPYLGETALIDEIAAAGGPREWTAPEPLAGEDFQRRLWAWLKRYQDGSDGQIPLYLGWGVRDDFARPNGLLGEMLPPGRVFTAEGGHQWKAWRALWEKFLESGALPERPLTP
jgi:pimeloyl-ACP methyl ester carboxylesterase